MSCLKHYLTVMTIIEILLGVTAMIMGGVQIHSGSDFWNASSYNWHKGTGGALIAFGGFLIVAGIFGLIGACRKSKCFLFFYDLFNVPLFISLLVIGIVALAASTIAANDIDNASKTCSGDNLNWLE